MDGPGTTATDHSSRVDNLLNACEEEIKALEEAQHKLQQKLKHVMNSDTMLRLEDELHDSSHNVDVNMRSIAKEVRKLQQEFEKHPETYETNMMALNRAVANEYTSLADKYPAAMKEINGLLWHESILRYTIHVCCKIHQKHLFFSFRKNGVVRRNGR